jgi:hypothetical protein
MRCSQARVQDCATDCPVLDVDVAIRRSCLIMAEADSLLSGLAAIGEDGCSAALQQQVRSAIPDAGFWGDKHLVQRLWESVDVDVRCVARGLRELLLNSSSKMGLATLYFHMLASKDAPVRSVNHLFLPQLFTHFRMVAIRAHALRLRSSLMCSASRSAGRRFVTTS